MFHFLSCLAGFLLNLVVWTILDHLSSFGSSIWCDPLIVELRVRIPDFWMHHRYRLLVAVSTMTIAFICYPTPLFLWTLGWTTYRWLRNDLSAEHILDTLALNLIAAYLLG